MTCVTFGDQILKLTCSQAYGDLVQTGGLSMHKKSGQMLDSIDVN